MAPTAKPAATKPAAAGKEKKLPAVPESKLKDGKRRLTAKCKLSLRKRVIRSKGCIEKTSKLDPR